MFMLGAGEANGTSQLYRSWRSPLASLKSLQIELRYICPDIVQIVDSLASPLAVISLREGTELSPGLLVHPVLSQQPFKTPGSGAPGWLTRLVVRLSLGS